MSWVAPQSNPDVRVSGYKVLVDGKQYGTTLHAGVKHVRIKVNSMITIICMKDTLILKVHPFYYIKLSILLSHGEVTIYSQLPIDAGSFVTPVDVIVSSQSPTVLLPTNYASDPCFMFCGEVMIFKHHYSLHQYFFSAWFEPAVPSSEYGVSV